MQKDYCCRVGFLAGIGFQEEVRGPVGSAVKHVENSKNGVYEESPKNCQSWGSFSSSLSRWDPWSDPVEVWSNGGLFWFLSWERGAGRRVVQDMRVMVEPSVQHSWPVDPQMEPLNSPLTDMRRFRAAKYHWPGVAAPSRNCSSLEQPNWFMFSSAKHQHHSRLCFATSHIGFEAAG